MLLCRDCGVLHPLPPSQPPPEPDYVEDLESFRSLHREHRLERAYRLSEPVYHDRPAWDPMARSWFRVSVGESALFVCSSRQSVDEPRHHEICPTPPKFTLRAEVDESALCAERSNSTSSQTGLPAERLDLIRRPGSRSVRQHRRRIT